jgi:uncharacterized surface protein with fasciclin (FAS1) repeats
LEESALSHAAINGIPDASDVPRIFETRRWFDDFRKRIGRADRSRQNACRFPQFGTQTRDVRGGDEEPSGLRFLICGLIRIQDSGDSDVFLESISGMRANSCTSSSLRNVATQCFNPDSKNSNEGPAMKSFSVRILMLMLVLGVNSLVHAEDKPKDIVDTAVAAGSFKTLAAALTAADLVDTLKGKGPFTVFAPTDEAFAKLPKGTLESLLKPENKKKLAGILTYHVVSGKVLAKDVVKLTEAKTVQGSSVKIVVKDGKVTVDGANVTATDIEASNGVIHVIDTVILPK